MCEFWPFMLMWHRLVSMSMHPCVSRLNSLVFLLVCFCEFWPVCLKCNRLVSMFMRMRAGWVLSDMIWIYFMCEFWPFKLLCSRLLSMIMRMKASILNSEIALKGVSLTAPLLGVHMNCFILASLVYYAYVDITHYAYFCGLVDSLAIWLVCFL